ncbi:MAG: ABC-type sugar transport system, periplasmic component [Actinomycetia bacterium]|nr:ABC-type sugar transport system, periplasmic component [Actinomycetes bacterium]
MTAPRTRRAGFAGACASALVSGLLVAGVTVGTAGATPSATTPVNPKDCAQAPLTKAKGPVDIVVWDQFQATNQDVLQALTDQFNASQSKIHVQLIQQPNADTYQKFRAGLTTGDLPDLMQVEEITLQSVVDSGATVPMQACVDATKYSLKDFLPKALGYYTTQGVLRSMPYGVSSPMLFYNKTTFSKAGLDPNKPPTTLAEVKADAQKIVSSGAAQYGMALRAEPFVMEFMYAKNNQTYVNNGNGRKARATKATFDNATGKQIFSWWKDMVDSKLMLDTGSDPANFDNLFAIGNGKAAMTIDGSGALGPINQVLSSGQYPGAVAAAGVLPGIKPANGVYAGEDSFYLMKKSSPAKRAAAWKFVQYLVATQQQVPLEIKTGYTPTRKSVAADPQVVAFWQKSPEYKIPYDQLLAGGTTPATSGAVVGPFEQVREMIRNELTAMLTQGQSVATTLAHAQSKADGLISDYNARAG